MQRMWWAVVGLTAVVGLAACGKKNEYPDGVRTVTYDSCVAGFKRTAGNRPNVDEAATSYCSCVLDSLQKSVPLKDFTAYDRMLISGEKSPERDRIEALVNGAVNVCLPTLTKK